MLVSRFGLLLKSARRQQSISRADLAARGGVSMRLVAELEQGKRPNVSFETALTLLNAAGVSIVARSPYGEVVEIRNRSTAALERAERAKVRRATWTGRRVSLHSSDDEPRPERSKPKRLSAVNMISRQAHTIAASRQGAGE